MVSMSNEWFYPRGKLTRDGWESVVDSTIPGWVHTGLRIAELADTNTRLSISATGCERLFIPLSGSFLIEYTAPGSEATERVELCGRASVFDGPSDVLYLGAGCTATITLRGTDGRTGRIAVAEAPTNEAHPARHITRAEVPLELRGAGRSSRQVHNFGTPSILEAGSFIVCEVITPAENWSSYPAHKHDEHTPGHESRLEEIYYFESALSRGITAPASAKPFGMFANYSSPAGAISTNAMVHSGDIALVPFGYHGPAVAAPGYDLYYLNVMAGPDEERVWNISDDPAHAWVRTQWETQEFDNRLPYLEVPTVEAQS